MKKILASIIVLVLLLGSFSSIACASSYCRADHGYLRIPRGSSASVIISTDANGISSNRLDNYGITRYGQVIGPNQYKFTFDTNRSSKLGVSSMDVSTDDGLLSTTIYLFVVDIQATDLYYASKTRSSITVEWDPTDVRRYQLQYRVKDGTWKTATDFTKNTRYTVKGLKKGTYYQFRVRSVNYDYDWGETYGNWSNVKTIKTKA